MVRTRRLARGGRCSLRGRLGFLRHHLREHLGVKGSHYIASGASSVQATIVPAGVERSLGVMSSVYVNDPSDPGFADFSRKNNLAQANNLKDIENPILLPGRVGVASTGENRSVFLTTRLAPLRRITLQK